MMFFPLIFALPAAYLAALIWLVIKRDRLGLVESVCYAALAIGTGAWAITRSRSSTAGIGFLFLPALAALAGLLGLLYGRWGKSAETTRRVIGLLASAGGLAIIVSNLVSGTQTITRNRTRDDVQARYSAAIASNRAQIATALQANPGRERAWLDSAIIARLNDRPFLLAALPHDSISPAVILTVAYNADLGVTLEALRNPNASARTLERVYRTASYPDYFYQALAAHHNTPPTLLRALHQNPGVISGLDIWLAGNPSTPQDVLTDIGRKTTDHSVVAALLENPRVDCTTMSALANNLMKKQNRDADNPNVARLTERMPTVCPNAPAG